MLSVIHQMMFVEEMEQQAEDHANQSCKGHAFQRDTAQLNGYTGQTDYQNEEVRTVFLVLL